MCVSGRSVKHEESKDKLMNKTACCNRDHGKQCQLDISYDGLVAYQALSFSS